MNAGYRVLAPDNGDLGEAEWRGVGFLAISPDQSSIGHVISGRKKEEERGQSP